MKVVVIDDAPDIAEVIELCFELRWPGTNLLVAPDGPKGLELVSQESPDLIILDIVLPEVDGYQVLREIRQSSQVPIIILSAKDQDTDIAKGLELGADDYITKPFSHIELLARAQAVLRRAKPAALGSDEPPFVSEDLRIDFATRTVWVEDRRVNLTPIEYNILCHLAKNAGRVVSQPELVTKVWGAGHAEVASYSKVLKVHIQHLRRKLGDEPSERYHGERRSLWGYGRLSLCFRTELGLGYRFLKQHSTHKEK